MFRLARKVLIALLLVGLAFGFLPVQAESKNLEELLPLTFTVKDVTLVWHEYTPGGVMDCGDKIKLVWGSYRIPDTIVDCFRDYYDVINFTDAPGLVVGWRDRPGLGTISWAKIWITEEVIIPKAYFKTVPTGAKGWWTTGHDFGGGYALKDFDESILNGLGLGPDSGCVWNDRHGGYYFGPQCLATIDQVANWLGVMYGAPHKEASPLWEENNPASDRYYANLGYEFVTIIGPKTAFPKTVVDYEKFRTFIGVDRALWAGIIKPEELTNEPISRAQFALLVSRALKLSGGSVDFSHIPWDLKEPKWQDYLPNIQALLSRGFMKLFSDGSFHPEGTMTREEVVKILYAIKTNNPSSVPQPSTPTTTQTQVLEFSLSSPEYLKNGQSYTMDTTPTILENRTYLPLRYVAEALGAQVEWNQGEQKVTVTTTRPVHFTDTKTDTTVTATKIELWVNQPLARVTTCTLYYGALSTVTETLPIDPQNTQVVPLLFPPGRVMLPLRFVAETLGAQVEWQSESQVIGTVSSREASAPEEIQAPESQKITIIYNLPGLIEAKEKAYLPPP
ncbi:MAG: stalk domain-containing protein [bacterium]